MRIAPSLVALAVAAVAAAGGTASAQYNPAAGVSAPMDKVAHTERQHDGSIRTTVVEQAPARDGYGNAAGNNHDLAIDGAFEGQTVAVIQLYTGEGFDFHLPRAALKEKGFSVYRWSDGVPTAPELDKALAKASQLWVIAGQDHLLTDAHLEVIKKYFDAGHGVYIWGDNEPYYADANFLAKALFGTEMLGDVMGDQVVSLERKAGGPGILPNHLLTTGLEHIYEGITIATIQPSTTLRPLIYGSAGNLVAAYYDHDGKRAILDGGFTRLYLKWDTAGTARYVKNAAAWLANAERFGSAVVAKGKTEPTPAEVAAAAAAATPKSNTQTTVTITPAPAPAFDMSRAIGYALLAIMLVILGVLVTAKLRERR